MGKRIGFVGPGMMGRRMIKNLLKNGFAIQIFIHRNAGAAEELAGNGATSTRSMEELARNNDVILIAVPGSPEVEDAVIGGNGLINYLEEGQLVIDHTTAYPESTKMISEKLGEKGIRMLDAPMTGSTPQAEQATLNFMVGGNKADFDETQDILQAMGKNIFYVGDHGTGHSVKLMNNFLGQLNASAIAEMLVFGQRYGVDLKAFFDVVSVSGGNSKSFQTMVPKLLERDFTVNFMLKLVHKDLRYITELGRVTGSPMPIANNIFDIFDMAKASGLGDENFSAVLKFYEKVSGVEVQQVTE